MEAKMNRVLLYSVLLSLLISSSWAQSGAITSMSENMDNDCARLQASLMQYKEIADRGGWPPVSEGAWLKRGDRGQRVVEIKRRLTVTGDRRSESSGPEDIFDEELHDSVVRFQRRHGLKEDGVVGPETIKNLNVPVENRIRQIEINIRRLKQMTECAETRYITVNIAAFDLHVIENENTVMSMKVIVGKPYWYSPSFSSTMTQIVFNPSWYVPNSIAIEEILPKIKEDPEYLVNEGIKVFEKGKGYRNELDASVINWADVNADNLTYRFVQVPGIRNPLGKIKFIFPNNYDVYLHDTPAKVLFEKSSRAFSHGCIRIEKPVELAEYLLRDDPAWNSERIIETVDSGEEVKIKIPSPIKIHILYLTAWVDEDNVLQFREDVYERDK